MPIDVVDLVPCSIGKWRNDDGFDSAAPLGLFIGIFEASYPGAEAAPGSSRPPLCGLRPAERMRGRARKRTEKQPIPGSHRSTKVE